MFRLTIGIAMALSLSLAAVAQDTAAPAADKAARAQEILKQARAALGDEGKVRALQSLTASGTSRRTFGERQTESEVEIDILLPDKIKRIENGQFGSNTTALNGSQVWTEFVSAVGGPGGGAPQVFAGGGDGNVRIVGPGGGGGGGGAGTGGGAVPSQAQAMLQQLQRAELTRLMLGLLLTPPAGVNLEFTYAGEAKAPDGMTADIIDAKGENFTARLFIDQKTHRLLMMGFKARQFRGRGAGGGRAGGGQGAGQGAGQGQGTGQGNRQGTGQGAGSGQGTGQGAGQGAGAPQGTGQGSGQGAGQGGQRNGQQTQMTPEERERRMRDAMERAPEVDVRLAFADYKTVNGISLPHRIVRSEGGTPTEETDISKYKINPSMKADKFEKKEKK
jgi:hypothetical protein